MTHPSIDQIVAGAAADHVGRCDACRRLALLAGVELAPPADDHDLDHLPAVDAAVYTEWTELAHGRGGMGRISRARDRRLGRFVAIKQLRPGLTADERASLVRRFEREARLTARLQHPAIVGVHEAGRFADGEPFYAMPLLAGEPLGRELAKRVTLAERLALLPHLTTVAEAVAYAHEQGIVHRDIKPDNILVGTFGETVLIDWGLAKDVTESGGEPAGAYRDVDQGSGGFTQLGVGTPQYMPLEQARGEEPDGRVDVYALGATLYQLLAGAPPYGDGDPSVVRRALAAGPPRPLREIADVPGELIDIVERAMARDPEARYQRARELADELRRFQTGQLLTSRRYTLRELVRHFAHKYRTALRISAVAAVVLIGVAVYAFARISKERDLARASQQRAERELRRAQGVVASQLAPDPARRMEALALAVRAVGPELAAGEPPVPEAYQGLVDALTAGPPLAPLPHDGLIKMWALAGDKLIGVDDARSLLMFDARSGKPLGKHPTELPQPEFVQVSPDGAHAAVCGFDPVGEVFDIATGAHRKLEAKTNFAWCTFLPDGRLITAADDITIRDPVTLAVAARFSLPSPAVGVDVGRSGRTVASLLDGSLWMWRPGGDPQHVPGPASGSVVRLDPQERIVYHNGSDLTVRAWAVDALGAPPAILHHSTQGHFGLTTISPDGRYVAVGMFDVDGTRRSLIYDRRGEAAPIEVGGMTFWWWRDRWLFADRRGPIELFDVQTRGAVIALEAHRDEAALDFVGDKLASRSYDGSAFLWDITPGTGLLLGHTAEIVAVVASGDRIATASRDGSVRVWRDGIATAAAFSEVELAAAAWSGDHVVVGDLEGTVRVLDGHTGAERARSRAGGPISVLATGGDRILIGALDGTLELRSSALASPVAFRTTVPVTAAALSPDGTRVVSGHADGSTRLWDARSGAAIAVRPDDDKLDSVADHEGHAALAFTTDGTRVLVSRPAGQLRVLDARDLQVRARLEGRQVGAIAGDLVAAAAPDGGVLVHDLAAGTMRRLVGHRQAVLAAVFSPDRGRLATASVDGSVRIWDLATGESQVTVASGKLGSATAIALADPDWLVIGYATGAVRLQPATPRAARERACTILARFGRTGDVAPYCNATASDRT